MLSGGNAKESCQCCMNKIQTEKWFIRASLPGKRMAFGTEMQSAFQSAGIGETCPRGSSSVLAGDTTADGQV